MDSNYQNSDFILYTSKDGDVRVDVFVNDETVKLTQKAMQELFDRSKSTVSEHIINIFKEGELDEIQVVRKFRTTADDGKFTYLFYKNEIKKAIEIHNNQIEILYFLLLKAVC
jgi:hypothetical protein